MSEATTELHEETTRQGRLGALASDVGPKLFVTAVAAGITALLIPWITGKWQDHKQQLELRTTLAKDMSRAYTSVIVTGRFVTGGLVYSGSSSQAANTAAAQTAWTNALHEWLVESGTIQAELTGRYPSHEIATEWHDFAEAVTRYMRIGSQVMPADRAALLRQEKAYAREAEVNWEALRRLSGFKRDPAFRASYAALGKWLLARGDAIVQDELRLDPRV